MTRDTRSFVTWNFSVNTLKKLGIVWDNDKPKQSVKLAKNYKIILAS